MDKTAIRNFAIEARKILMKSAITEAGFYGITKDGCKDPVQKGNDFEVYETVAGTENRIFGDDIKRRANLVQAIKTLGFEQVIEETAYTWFNRIIAIRFMEVNNYLPTRVRVLSSETGSGTPDIITQADTVELNLTSDELEKIQTAKRENRYDDAFRMLFIKQCNELNAILPGLFEKTDDYMELLLKITYTGDGVIRMLVDSIPEDNFNVETEGQVEIIGWMYQYYNTELKDDTFAKLKKNVKITKERIPAATQLFTPDWIVRYMVENSLGRVWIEHLRAVNPSVDEKTKAEEFGWKYYLPEAEQEDDVQAQLVEIRKSYKDLTPQDITCIDPCMGSGHILVYMFDVLMDIYRSEGFSEREAVFDILEKNIRGLDIDRRAYQLSYFALMMKARGYNRIFFRGHENSEGNRVFATPLVYAIEESNSIDRNQLQYYGVGLDALSKNNAINQMNGLLDSFVDAKEYGSILKIENYDWTLLKSFVAGMEEEGQGSLFGYAAYQSKPLLERLLFIGETLSRRYNAVITNPPYMSSNGMGDKLSNYIKTNYPDSKADLFATFIEKGMTMCDKRGFLGMITQHSWMFLVSFESLRSKVEEKDIVNMVHLGAHAFEEIGGEIVQTTSFVISNNRNIERETIYVRLTDYDDAYEKQKNFGNIECRFMCKNSNYDLIPTAPISYWIGQKYYDIFKTNPVFGEYGNTKKGVLTGNDKRFVRIWYEVEKGKIGRGIKDYDDMLSKNYKWIPATGGGPYRKWYGNFANVINMENDSAEIRYDNANNFRLRESTYYFRECFTWSEVCRSLAVRYVPQGILFGNSGPVCFLQGDIYYWMAVLNSKIAMEFMKFLSPTLTFGPEQLKRVPCVVIDKETIENLSRECIDIARKDWDDNEVSWDYERNPLASIAIERRKTEDNLKLEDCYKEYEVECSSRISIMKDNEEQINRLLIKGYGLDAEINAVVDDKDIVLHRANPQEDIKALVSYSVGCMLGRYSLDETGIINGGEMIDISRYKLFSADIDGIIPIVDEAYFDDDIVGRFESFISTLFGKKYLNENMEFVAASLGSKGNNAQEKIRNYFLQDFYKDHCSLYAVNNSGKRPIYWLFDAGKENGFKCLIYLHRYNADTIGLIRSDYLTKAQSMIENALKNADYAINSSSSAVDRAQATKKRDKYIKQLAEIRAYYPALSHIALQRIELDLDDGVKANYEKFQNIEVSIEGEKKQKVNLLSKI